MTAADVSLARGGDVFTFDYGHANVADTIVFESGSWPFAATTNIEVGEYLAPSRDDAGAALAASWTTSIGIMHLDAVSSAHVVVEGTGYTIQYSLDSNTWVNLPQNGVIDPTLNYFDLRIQFAAGVANGRVDRVTIYLLATDSVYSTIGRELTFSADRMVNGTLIASGGNGNPTVVASAAENNFYTIEAWLKLTTATTVLQTATTGTSYRNGIAGNPIQGVLTHWVRTLSSPLSSVVFNDGVEISHLALYPQSMGSAEVADLYLAQTFTPLHFSDPATVRLTEGAAPVKIYAYNWTKAR